MSAAFLAKVNKSTFTFEEKPRLVFGGISSSFAHATATEAFLEGKALDGNEILQEVLKKLDTDVVPEESPLLTDGLYRKHLASALFYKVP